MDNVIPFRKNRPCVELVEAAEWDNHYVRRAHATG